jgi:hypothetical protein
LLACGQQKYRERGALPEVNHVLVIENKGKVVGVSNPHPHCQIYATNFVFKTIEVEVNAAARYWREHRRALLESLRASLDDTIDSSFGGDLVVNNGVFQGGGIGPAFAGEVEGRTKRRVFASSRATKPSAGRSPCSRTSALIFGRLTPRAV